MDIICAKCGRHFSSIEAAREHRGQCKETSEGEPIHWIQARKSKITPEEWEKLINLINYQDVSPATKLSEVSSKSIESKSSKEISKSNTSISDTNSKNIKGINQKHEAIKDKKSGKTSFNIKNWMIALLFIFAFSVIGLGISVFIHTPIPFWLLFGFSVIFSIEKWFNYLTRKHKFIGKIYRVLLNLTILSILVTLIWSGIKLFSGQFAQSSLVGSLIFVAEFVFFIWLWRVISKNSWRWPSMKLTIFSLICLFIIFAFAGVKPFSDYKYSIISRYAEWRKTTEQTRLEKEAAAKAEAQERVKEAIAMMPIPLKEAPTTARTESSLTTTQALQTEEAEQEGFKLINTTREDAGIPATKWNDELYKLSKQHTQAMADRGELFHTPLGSSSGENAWGGTGYYHYRYDELAKVIVDSWMSSPLHKAWLLHAPIKESVVSIVVTPDSQYASWSFWMNSFDRGPELIEKVVAEWKASGSGLDWIPWLESKGYLH